jgi:hypothetical protein
MKMETAGPMNGPHEEPKSEFKVSVSYGKDYAMDDKFRSERKAEHEKELKELQKVAKSMTPEKAYSMVKASLDKSIKECELECARYDDSGSVGDAYDEDEEDDKD